MQNTLIQYTPNRHQSLVQHLGQTPAGELPAGILPMHNHPKTAIPQETQRRWNHLASVGVAITIAGALLAIGTKFKGVETFLRKNLSEKNWQWLAQKSLESRTWQMIGIGGLLQSVNRYETAANTNQPSKLVAALISTGQAFGFLFSHNWPLLAMGFLTSAFIYLGEQNDIENSNHPDKRREWDLKRLSQSFKNHSFIKEAISATKFIWGDFKRAFSVQHWRNLKTRGFSKETWNTPQSYQSALGVQFSLLSFVLHAGLNMCGNSLQGIVKVFTNWAMNTTNLIGSIVPQFPVASRAWQNNDQADGRLVLFGSPLISAGRFFQMRPAWSFLAGLGFVGDAIKGKGLALNSQKYLALLNQMRSIQMLTERDPYITASTVLTIMMSSPDVTDRLRKQMGQPRLDFLLQLLHNAEEAYKKNGTSLNSFLTPILETNNYHSPFTDTPIALD